MEDLSSSEELIWLHDSLAVHTAFWIILLVSYFSINLKRLVHN